MSRSGATPEPLNALEVKARAKRINRIIYSSHAEERMLERDILAEDVLKVFDLGAVCDQRYEGRSWKYSMELIRHDLCCRHVVVFSFVGKEAAVVITVIEKGV